MLKEIEERNQATDLQKLVGKFTSERGKPRHLNRVIKILDCLRNSRVLIAELKRGRKHLLNQIAQQNLIIEDCHSTMIQNKQTIAELQKQNHALKEQRFSAVA
jgi:hypothetical protein